jgi:hypothetical protein
MPEEKKPQDAPLPAPPTPAPKAPESKAKPGDHVLFTDKAGATFQAIVTSCTGESASLKVVLPKGRKTSGGVAKVDGVPFAARPKGKDEKPQPGTWAPI